MARAAGRPSRAPRRRGRAARPGAGLVAVAVASALLTACTADGTTHDPAGSPAPTAVASTPPAVEEAPATEPLVTATPDAHSEVGELVEGFPVDLLPVPSDAVILVTSAVPVGDAEVQEVSLNLSTAATVTDLADLYRTALTTAGFTEVLPTVPSSDLAAEATYVRSRGDELISIGVIDEGDARTVTVGGRVRTATP